MKVATEEFARKLPHYLDKRYFAEALEISALLSRGVSLDEAADSLGFSVGGAKSRLRSLRTLPGSRGEAAYLTCNRIKWLRQTCLSAFQWRGGGLPVKDIAARLGVRVATARWFIKRGRRYRAAQMEAFKVARHRIHKRIAAFCTRPMGMTEKRPF